ARHERRNVIMRRWRRRKLLAGIGTALGLCAAGVGCQSSRPAAHSSGPAVTMGAPVVIRTASAGEAGSAPRWTARAAPPGPWRSAEGAGDAGSGGLRPVTFHAVEAPTEPPADVKVDR